MTNWALWGTIVNAVLVLFGALFGLAIRHLGHRATSGGEQLAENGKPSRFSGLPDLVQKGLGLCVLLIGIQGALGVSNMLVMILSVVLGAIIGELCGLDALLKRLGDWLEHKMKGKGNNIAEGFVSATLLFCVGAMTVTGAIEGGLSHQHTTYYAKGVIDMASAVIFASSLGVGVVFSSLAVFVVQGTLTLIAVVAAGAIPALVTAEMIAVGSLLIIAIGTNLLGLTKIKVMNLVPATFMPLALCPLFEVIPIF